MLRHLAILRSLCEGLGGKPHYCVCGKQTDDTIHFKTTEFNSLSKDKKLTEWRGLTVNKDDLAAAP